MGYFLSGINAGTLTPQRDGKLSGPYMAIIPQLLGVMIVNAAATLILQSMKEAHQGTAILITGIAPNRILLNSNQHPELPSNKQRNRNHIIHQNNWTRTHNPAPIHSSINHNNRTSLQPIKKTGLTPWSSCEGAEPAFLSFFMDFYLCEAC